MACTYYDLNVPFADDLVDTAKKVERLVKFGYRVVALSKIYVPTNKRKRGGKKPLEVCEETTSHKIIADKILQMISEKPPDLKILTRVTVSVDNPDQVRCLQEDFVKSFDIVAIRPTNERIFQQACTQWESIDIISSDIDHVIPFKIKHSMIRAAVERGIMIEFSYASAIRSSSLRRMALTNSVNLVKYSKGKGIIITSNGEHFMEMRSPKDIINLGGMFGLNGSQAKDAICGMCRKVVLHAYARSQTAKGVITMKRIGAASSDLEKIVNESFNDMGKDDKSDCTPVLKKKKK